MIGHSLIEDESNNRASAVSSLCLNLHACVRVCLRSHVMSMHISYIMYIQALIYLFIHERDVCRFARRTLTSGLQLMIYNNIISCAVTATTTTTTTTTDHNL